MTRTRSRTAVLYPGLLLAVLLSLARPLVSAPPVPDSGSRRDCGPGFSLGGFLTETTRPAFSLDLAYAFRTGADGVTPANSSPSRELRMKRKWGRACLEFGALFTYSAINYWRKYTLFIEDWQYELTCEDQYRRFFTTEALKFDSNSFYLNWSHSLSGAVYYQFARTNYLSWLESWIFATVGSLLWEYGVEWREVVSINDNVFTGLGSYAVGEAWYTTARYLAAQPQAVLQILSFMNPFLRINQWLDRKKPASKAYNPPARHDFEISLGARRLSRRGRERQDGLYVSLRTEIGGPAGFGKPGIIRRTVHDSVSSELSLDLAWGGNRDIDEAFARGWAEEDLAAGGWADEINFSARAVNWALIRQDIDELSRGSAFSIGLGSAFTYFRKTPALRIDTGEYRIRTGEDLQLDKARFFRDKISVVHVAGPVLDWWRFGRETKLRLSAEAYADLALVNSFALNLASEDQDISGMKTTLLHYGYYYAWGASLRGRCDVEWRSFRVRSLAVFQAWDSIEGLDRFQADLTDDGDIDDSRIRILLGVDWKVPRLPLGLFFTFEGIRRRGRLGETEVTGSESRAYAGLRFFL